VALDLGPRIDSSDRFARDGSIPAWLDHGHSAAQSNPGADQWSRDTIAGSARGRHSARSADASARGANTIEFVSENPGIHIPTDTRLLAIMVRDLEIRTETESGCVLER